MKEFKFDADIDLSQFQIAEIEDQIAEECIKRNWDREKIAWTFCILVRVRKL